MATTAQKNGVEKRTATNKAQAQSTNKAKATIVPDIKINLDERINSLEKLKGLASKREILVTTLNKLTKFNYNQGGSLSFMLKDATGLEFTTSNTNLIELITNILQETLEIRKVEIEDEIIKFNL